MDNSKAFITAFRPDRDEAPWLYEPYKKLPVFYRVVRLKDGELWDILNEGSYPTVWGFETYKEAEDVCRSYNDGPYNPESGVAYTWTDDDGWVPSDDEPYQNDVEKDHEDVTCDRCGELHDSHDSGLCPSEY